MKSLKIIVTVACFSAGNVGAQGLVLPLLATENLGGLFSLSEPLAFINSASTSSIPVVSGLLAGNGDSLSALTLIGAASLNEPQEIISTLTGLGLPLAGEYVPVLDVLLNNPASILTYLIEGNGILLSDGIAALPDIPVISSPLSGL